MIGATSQKSGILSLISTCKVLKMDDKNKYTVMQQSQYERHANEWSLQNRDPVVGLFDQHNAWKDYDDFLFKGVGGGRLTR